MQLFLYVVQAAVTTGITGVIVLLTLAIAYGVLTHPMPIEAGETR